MNIIADLHTHTTVSHHAYSTLAELLDEAKKKDLYAMALTNHAPAMEDGARALHFKCLAKLPKIIDGVRLYRGTELNITDFTGSIDLSNTTLGKLDFVIASYHIECIKSGTVEEHTQGWLGAIKNPYVDCMGHSGNPTFAFDMARVVLECKKLGKIIEINASSEHARKGSYKNCKEIALLCKKHGVHLAVNSDAHSKWSVGEFGPAIDLLKEVDFPEEMVINSSIERLHAYLEKRAQRIAGSGVHGNP